MDCTQLNARSFAASLVRKSRKIDELAPGDGFSELQLLAVFMKGLPMEYKELVQHLSFKKNGDPEGGCRHREGLCGKSSGD